jgi:hypothetical protein
MMKWATLLVLLAAGWCVGYNSSSDTCNPPVTEFCKAPSDLDFCRPDAGWASDAACPSQQEVFDRACISGANTQEGPRMTNDKCCYDVRFLCE